MNSLPILEIPPSRRPVAMRSSQMLQQLARWLATRGVSANAVSLLSIGCALVAAFALVGYGLHGGILPLLTAAIFIFARGICNLLDGLIAIENDRRSPVGAFFNEAPDRISDTLLFTALGLAWDWSWMGLSAGLSLSLLCLATAYVRALGKTLTGEDDFRGPLAKPHRVGVLIVGLLVGSLLPSHWPFLAVTLVILFLGTLLTIATRTCHLLNTLKARA